MTLSLANLRTREQIPELLTGLGLVGEGVEVGVALGWYSDVILRNRRLERLFSVDPWNSSEDYTAEFHGLASYRAAVATLAAHGDRSVIVRLRSLEAVEQFDDGALDFVSIDAFHAYPAISADLRAWWPKVRSGGIFSGHDYGTFHTDVTRAVDEFFSERGHPFFLTELDFEDQGHDIRSWVTQKP